MKGEYDQRVEIYTDGAAKANPTGPGGYAAIVKIFKKDSTDTYESIEEFAGGYPKTTNNKMELMGVIVGLESLKVPSMVRLYSDSSYVINAFNKRWMYNWKRNGWKTATGKPVKNQDLWERLLKAKEDHQITFVWVKGHDGNIDNERCDFLASTMCDPFNTLVKKNGIYVGETKDKNENE